MHSQPEFRQGPALDLQPLAAAMAAKDARAVRMILMSLSDEDSHDPSDGSHALHFAAHFNDVPSIQQLIRRGADVRARDTLGRTATMRAAAANAAEALQILLDATDHADLRDNSGSAALHHAAGAKAHETLKLLVKDPARVNLRNSAGETAMHIAASFGASRESIEILLAAGAGMDIPNLAADRPLHKAVEWEAEEVVRLLLRRGAPTISVNDLAQLPEVVPAALPPVDPESPARAAVFHTRWLRQLVYASRNQLQIKGG